MNAANTTSDLFPVPAIEAVEDELRSIEKELAALAPLQERQAQLKTWLQLTRQVFPTTAPEPPRDVRQPAEKAAEPWPFGRGSVATSGVLLNPKAPMKDQIVEAAARVFKAKGAMPSKAMLEQIEALGVVVRGVDKSGTVATILSKSPRFRNDRSLGGWVLIE